MQTMKNDYHLAQAPEEAIQPTQVKIHEKSDDLIPVSKQLRVVIIGGGIAAVTAAAGVRKNNPDCSIEIYAQEAYLPYYRPMLTKTLLTMKDPNKIVIHELDWFNQHKIEINLNTEIVSIDPEHYSVTTKNGQIIDYDKLIIATGAQCSIPKIPGSQHDCVQVIRNIDDVKRIQQIVVNTMAINIIGGGVLGLEIAWELNKLGCIVNIIEVASRLMGRQLDDITSDALAQQVKQAGCNIYLEAKIDYIDSNGDIYLTGGQIINGQLVIISAGITPNIEIAKAAGIECGKAIKVDINCITNLPDIYASGDCAEFNGINYALWSEAVSMADVAANNATGVHDEYYDYVPSVFFQGMDTKLYAIGDVGKVSDIEYHLEVLGDIQERNFKRFYFNNQQLCGAILFGDLSQLVKVNRILLEKITIEEFKNKVSEW